MQTKSVPIINIHCLSSFIILIIYCFNSMADSLYSLKKLIKTKYSMVQ